ncbi:MAG: hypothetical protein CMM56_08930 [Rhodospirillaceae bacterium]|jgi:Uncharacterized protein conserved in bacteria|nr:hypothetical protein [Rhodospirillaceae bacterium]|tara:strand:- start:224 stop:694 length:471 start_codon:yes stop_codon:yes gene_type:complete
MKETVLDVLMYLFEVFVEGEDYPEPDRNELQEDLKQVGFGQREIERALDWLDGLNSEKIGTNSSQHETIRLYDTVEQNHIDPYCRGYILHLEQIGILAPDQRELVIDRLLALGSDDIDVEQIKWVVMMVLFSQPGQEQAYEQMEDLVYAEDSVSLH